MPFDPTPMTIPIKRTAKRATYAPSRGWRDRLLEERGVALPPPASQLVRDLREALCLLVVYGWTRGAFAETARNIRCSPTDGGAAKFCAAGAVLRAVLGIRDDIRKTRTVAEITRIDTAMAALGLHADGPVMEFNDALDAAKVISLFERTIDHAVAHA